VVNNGKIDVPAMIFDPIAWTPTTSTAYSSADGFS